MQIPKEIDKLLETRAKAAVEFTYADAKLNAWLEENEIKVGKDNINLGTNSFSEPYDSIDDIRKCIRKK